MFFKNSTIVSAFILTTMAFAATQAGAAIHVGDTANYATDSKLMIDGKPTEEHSLVTDTAKAVNNDGTIQFEETRKTDSTTTTETVTYSESAWLMSPDDGPATGDELLSNCGDFPGSKKVTVSLKSGNVDGCDVIQTSDQYTLHIVYAPVPLYIYSLEYHDVDEDNAFDLTQQYVEPEMFNARIRASALDSGDPECGRGDCTSGL